MADDEGAPSKSQCLISKIFKYAFITVIVNFFQFCSYWTFSAPGRISTVSRLIWYLICSLIFATIIFLKNFLLIRYDSFFYHCDSHCDSLRTTDNRRHVDFFFAVGVFMGVLSYGSKQFKSKCVNKLGFLSISTNLYPGCLSRTMSWPRTMSWKTRRRRVDDT